MTPDADRLERHEIGRTRAAAHHVTRVYPGPVGRLLARELIAYAEFGWRFPRDGLTESVVREVLRRDAADDPAPAPVPLHHARDACSRARSDARGDMRAPRDPDVRETAGRALNATACP